MYGYLLLEQLDIYAKKLFFVPEKIKSGVFFDPSLVQNNLTIF